MRIQSIQESNQDKLLQKSNVCGVAIGKKFIDGKPTNQDAILVFVESKLSEENMLRTFSADDIIPQTIDDIPTDIIEVGKIVKQSFKTLCRPIKPGYSCGHVNITAGTVGGFFIDKDGEPVMLSNNHVLACENNAKKGDMIVQPGPTDSGGKQNAVGTLKSFCSLNTNNNQHDSAIALIDSSIISKNQIDNIYPTINRKLSGFGKAAVNMPVQKCGRTTGYTTGTIMGVNATFTIHYDAGPLKFEKCIAISPMSAGGDSGSLILDMNMNAVGLLFAGSTRVTIANDIELVRDYYGLRLWDAPTNSVNCFQLNWKKFTADGKIEVKNEAVTITDNCNNYCFLESTFENKVKAVSCAINTGTDCGASWGPGLVLQFPNGTLQVNLRINGTFGGCFNNSEQLNIGKVLPNKEYTLRLRKTATTWVGEVRDGDSWYTVITIPRSILATDPIAVRIGKTGFGLARDHTDPGPIGTCVIREFKTVI